MFFDMSGGSSAANNLFLSLPNCLQYDCTVNSTIASDINSVIFDCVINVGWHPFSAEGTFRQAWWEFWISSHSRAYLLLFEEVRGYEVASP